ncbi:radial spoke head protein 3 homolog [Prionailurus iriomotensis]
MGTYTYTYTSRPRALPCQRRRYRDHLMQLAEEPVHHGNIMYDRRVVRGNTYALHTGPLALNAKKTMKQCLQRFKGKIILGQEFCILLSYHFYTRATGRHSQIFRS